MENDKELLFDVFLIFGLFDDAKKSYPFFFQNIIIKSVSWSLKKDPVQVLSKLE